MFSALLCSLLLFTSALLLYSTLFCSPLLSLLCSALLSVSRLCSFPFPAILYYILLFSALLCFFSSPLSSARVQIYRSIYSQHMPPPALQLFKYLFFSLPKSFSCTKICYKVRYFEYIWKHIKNNWLAQKIKINLTHSPSTGLRLDSKFACGFLLMPPIEISIQYWNLRLTYE